MRVMFLVFFLILVPSLRMLESWVTTRLVFFVLSLLEKKTPLRV